MRAKCLKKASRPEVRTGLESPDGSSAEQRAAATADAAEPLAGHLVLVVGAERALVAFERFLLLALLLEGEAAQRPGIGIVAVDIQGGVEILDGGVVFADGDRALGAGLVGWRDVGVAVDRRIEIRDCELVLALQLVDEAARVEGFRRLLVEFDGARQ